MKYKIIIDDIVHSIANGLDSKMIMGKLKPLYSEEDYSSKALSNEKEENYLWSNLLKKVGRENLLKVKDFYNNNLLHFFCMNVFSPKVFEDFIGKFPVELNNKDYLDNSPFECLLLNKKLLQNINFKNKEANVFLKNALNSNKKLLLEVVQIIHKKHPLVCAEIIKENLDIAKELLTNHKFSVKDNSLKALIQQEFLRETTVSRKMVKIKSL